MLMLRGQVGRGCRAACREQMVFLGVKTAQDHAYSTEKSETFPLSGDRAFHWCLREDGHGRVSCRV